ncbi:MAG: RsiV family protein [Cloacibacillus sp.]
MRSLKNAAVIAAACALFAANAAFAQEPGVNILKFSVYNSEFRGFEAKIVTPVVTGLSVKKEQEAVNDAIFQRALSVTTQYQKEVQMTLADDPNFSGHMGVVFDYAIRCDSAKVLALDVYEMNIAGSSSTTHTFYNFDKQAGKLIYLEDFFNGKADFVKPISEYITQEMKRRNKKDGANFWIAPKDPSGFTGITATPKFYINDKGSIVICFDKYEVAPGSTGSPEFVIPHKVIAPYMAKNNILSGK